MVNSTNSLFITSDSTFSNLPKKRKRKNFNAQHQALSQSDQFLDVFLFNFPGKVSVSNGVRIINMNLEKKKVVTLMVGKVEQKLQEVRFKNHWPVEKKHCIDQSTQISLYITVLDQYFEQ